MATPSDKSPAVTGTLDQLTKALFGSSRTDSITADKCIICKGDASEFDNNLSRVEYGISGMCQLCQDQVFKDCEEY